MKTTLEQVRDDLIKAIRREASLENSSFVPLNLIYLRNEYDLNPALVGRILNRYARWKKKGTFKKLIPEFDVKYQPGWDDDVIVTRR